MPPRAPVALGVAVLAALLVSGCTAYDDLQRLVSRAQGQPELREVVKLQERVDFALGDEPPLPPAVQPGIPPTLPPARVHEFAFGVAPGARSLAFDATVTWRDPAAPSGAAVGRVNVTLTDPQGTVHGWAFEALGAGATGSEGVVVEPPAPGPWAVRVETLGEGRVVLHAAAVEPA